MSRRVAYMLAGACVIAAFGLDLAGDRRLVGIGRMLLVDFWGDSLLLLGGLLLVAASALVVRAIVASRRSREVAATLIRLAEIAGVTVVRIPFRRSRTLALTVLHALLALGSIAVFVRFAQESGLCCFRMIGYLGLSLGAALVLSAVTLWLASSILSGQPALLLTEDGLVDCSRPFGAGEVAWAEIVEAEIDSEFVGEMAFAHSFALQLNPDGRAQRSRDWLARVLNARPRIPLFLLDISAPALIEMLEWESSGSLRPAGVL
ncbi:MAG: hypothetical protein ACXVY3_10350 [Gaiellaceae bacterium]